MDSQNTGKHRNQSSRESSIWIGLAACIFIFYALSHLNKAEKKPLLSKSEARCARVLEKKNRDQKTSESDRLLYKGLKQQGEYKLVYATCSACHSINLVTQNRATAEGWKDMIRWMQETQGLWDLGENEDRIISYLAQNYGVEEQGRRKALENVEWYYLEN